MPRIREFLVTDPPTANDVKREALRCFGDNKPLDVTLLGDHQTPAAFETSTETFRIHTLQASDNDPMRVLGRTEDDRSVVITIPAGAGALATASIVTREP